jgi:hypothetical protein
MAAISMLLRADRIETDSRPRLILSSPSKKWPPRKTAYCQPNPIECSQTGFETMSLEWNDHTDRGGGGGRHYGISKTSKQSRARTMLRLADLEHSKNAVLHFLGAASSQESCGHAIDEFIGWCCSEPYLALNRTVVLRHRFFLEQKNLAPSAINVRLAAVRRLAYEASDTGLLSPDLAEESARREASKRISESFKMRSGRRGSSRVPRRVPHIQVPRAQSFRGHLPTIFHHLRHHSTIDHALKQRNVINFVCAADR